MKVRHDELQAFAQGVIDAIPRDGTRAVLVALTGDLGAGKTTLVQAIATELGIFEPVQSPTYVLMKTYNIPFGHFKKLIHIDAYRLKDKEEFQALKPEEFLSDPQALVCVEWPEKVAGALPTPDIVLTLSSEGAEEGERHIEMK